MALIKCIECGNKVSDQAKSCPECGCPVEPKKIEKKIVCFECGASISDKNETCPKCGVPLKEISKNKASKKEPINFFKAENTTKTPKFDWNNKKIKFLAWVFCGIALLYFLNSIFAPTPPQYIRTPVYVPTPSQPAPVDRCRACKIMGDCSFVPGCITRQENCQFKFNDITGNWEKNCTSF